MSSIKNIYVNPKKILSTLTFSLFIAANSQVFAVTKIASNSEACLKGLQVLSSLEQVQTNNSDKRKSNIKNASRSLRQICGLYDKYNEASSDDDKHGLLADITKYSDRFNDAIAGFVNDPAEVNVQYNIDTFGDLAEAIVALTRFQNNLELSQGVDEHDNQFLLTIKNSINTSRDNAKKLLNNSIEGLTKTNTTSSYKIVQN